jgi:signal transduction histidine kinase
MLSDEPSAALEAIDVAAAHLTVAVDQLRETAVDLLPIAPIAPGLEDGVQLLAEQASARGNLDCQVRIDPDTQGVDTQTALTIIRELLRNVERHAQATCASVEVAPGPGRGVRIIVADDGVGLSKGRLRKAVVEGHLGLSLVAARIKQLGGTLDILPNPGGGTRVTIDLPASAEA